MVMIGRQARQYGDWESEDYTGDHICQVSCKRLKKEKPKCTVLRGMDVGCCENETESGY